MKTEKNLIFELLCKTPDDEILNLVFKNGKKKSFCPIRILKDEEIELIAEKAK